MEFEKILPLLVGLLLGVIGVNTYHTASTPESSTSIESLQVQIDALNRQLLAFDGRQDSRKLPSGPPGFTYASDFGAVGDSVTDDAAALQAAIDFASQNLGGGTVVLGAGTFYITEPLVLPGGVTLQGQGYGSSPLAIKFDAGASTIAYCGTDYAVRVTGHSASIRDVAVYDWPYPAGGICSTLVAAGGVLVDADASLIESVTMSNVLLYFFLGGPALTLKAVNDGGIGYASFSDIRIRHAKVGIHLVAESGSFVNSNQFYGGAISGAITNVGLLAEGPGSCNDNKFYGIVIEPPVTSTTHVHVIGPATNVRMHDIRLEGTGMVAYQRPLVIIEDESYNNVMNGMLGHTHVQADFLRNPEIDFVNAKTVGIDPPPLNLFSNAAFNSFDGTNLPGWNLPGTNRKISVLSATEMLFADHQVLYVDYLGWGGPFQLSPKSLPKSPVYSQCTFGIYARASVPNAIVATMKYEDGTVISSSAHSGSGEWEFIAMSALYDATTKNADPKFSITGDVAITAPTFSYGGAPASPGTSLMSASGASMDGTFTMAMATAKPPASGTVWVLPKTQGNIITMDMQNQPSLLVTRLNDYGPDRFPRGTVVTLLFPKTGITVKHSAYIQLRDFKDFTATVPNSSLTLVANGDPTWTEISRN